MKLQSGAGRPELEEASPISDYKEGTTRVFLFRNCTDDSELEDVLFTARSLDQSCLNKAAIRGRVQCPADKRDLLSPGLKFPTFPFSIVSLPSVGRQICVTAVVLSSRYFHSKINEKIWQVFARTVRPTGVLDASPRRLHGRRYSKEWFSWEGRELYALFPQLIFKA